MMNDNSYTPPTFSLDEDEVKRRFVPFLKDFYKNRYQSDPSGIEVELDNVSAEGWVADGRLSFVKEDGSPFVCTYEATSRDKAQEVRYQLNTNYFLWDCTAFGAVSAALGYLFFFETRLPWMVQLKTIGNIGILLGVFIIGFFGWYFSMLRWRKYRYIYAIEQFKLYGADEQWVALAEDVFPARNDPFYLELKNQCIYHGVGLAIIPFEGVVQKICDPSRLGIYGKDKKMADWVTRAEWYQRMSENVSAMAARRPKAPDQLTVLWNRLYRPLHYLVIDPFKKYVWGALSKPLGESTTAYSRFMRAQTVQKWVTVIALAVIAPLFWKVVSFKTENLADLEELQQWKGGKNPEDEAGYLIDGEAIPYDGKPTGVPKQYPISSKATEDDGPTIDLSGDGEEENTIVMSSEEPETPPSKPKARPAPVTPPANACAQLNRAGWIVQESSFSTKNLAESRAATLKKQGIDSRFAAQNCLPGITSSGYVVWLGNVQNSEAAAKQASANYEKALQRYGLLKGKLYIRKLK
ncbi:MAG: hypothetical protein JNJ57_19080 [Saprospiraceae bacterium]|nr:hypothetical protein [Saprospiraceae bacterium]